MYLDKNVVDFEIDEIAIMCHEIVRGSIFTNFT